MIGPVSVLGSVTSPFSFGFQTSMCLLESPTGEGGPKPFQKSRCSASFLQMLTPTVATNNSLPVFHHFVVPPHAR